MMTAIIGSLCLLVISLWMMHRAVRVFDLGALTIPAVVYFAYLVLLYLPGIYIFWINSDSHAGWYFAALNVFLMAFPGGIILVKLIFTSPAAETRKFMVMPVLNHSGRSFEVAYSLVLAACAVMVVYYLSQVQTIPLFYMLMHPGSSDTIAQLREDSFKLLAPWGPLAYLFAWLRGMVLPFLAMIALGALWTIPARRAFWIAMFVISLGLAVFFASLSVAKAPVAAVFVMLLFTWYLLKSGRIGPRSIALFLVLILVFPFAVVFIQNGLQVDQLGYATGGILGRIFISPADDLYQYFRAFPDQADFLMGRSVAWVRLIGLEYFDTANFVALLQNPSTLVSASSTVAFTGNLWADFGFAGVIYGSFLAGALVQGVQVYLVRQPRDIIHTALYAFLAFALFGLTATSLTTTLVTGGVVPVLFLVLILVGLDRLFNKSLFNRIIST